MVKYVDIDNEKVSAEWYCVLRDMRADGIFFNVNEGHRTMARQTYFYQGWIRRLPGFAIAAFPSPFAPHIRTGRIDHAIDFSNNVAVYGWLSKHNLQPNRTVRWPDGSVREPWHIECLASVLAAYAKAHDTRNNIIRKGSHGSKVKTLQVLLRQAGYLRSSWKAHEKYTLTVRRAVRKFQKEHNLPVDGVVGPKTWKSLRAAKKTHF